MNNADEKVIFYAAYISKLNIGYLRCRWCSWCSDRHVLNCQNLCVRNCTSHIVTWHRIATVHTGSQIYEFHNSLWELLHSQYRGPFVTLFWTATTMIINSFYGFHHWTHCVLSHILPLKVRSERYHTFDFLAIDNAGHPQFTFVSCDQFSAFASACHFVVWIKIRAAENRRSCLRYGCFWGKYLHSRRTLASID